MIDVQPGSIKDRALQTIHSLGEYATRGELGKRLDCNGALLSIALEGMERDHWIRKNEHGVYELLVEIDVAPVQPAKAGEQGGGSEPSELNAVARAEPRAPRPAADTAEGEVNDRSLTKLCPACGEEKRRHQDFEPGAHRCKQCVKEDRPKMKPHERVARTKQPAEDAHTERMREQAPTLEQQNARQLLDPAECIIPAEGSLRCRFDGDRFEIRQGDQVITGSREQLEELCDWGKAKLF